MAYELSKLAVGDVTLDCPVYPGVKVTLRRLRSSEAAVARDAALKAIRAMSTGAETWSTYGFDEPDAHGVRLKLEDPYIATGALFTVGIVERALVAVRAIDGVELEGQPLPLDRRGLGLLLQDANVAFWLDAEIDKASRLLSAEGNA